MSRPSPDEPVTTAKMLGLIETGWQELQSFLKTLSEEQITQPTDAAGWTVKDHIIHLAVWEKCSLAVLNHGLRGEALGVDQETVATRDFDKINAVIHRNHRDMPLPEVTQTSHAHHAALVSKIAMLSDAELRLPFKHFQSNSSAEFPIFGYIVGTTFGHYEEHLPWMAAIAGVPFEKSATEGNAPENP